MGVSLCVAFFCARIHTKIHTKMRQEGNDVKVNGSDVILEKEISLMQYLEENGYQISRIVTELNTRIVSKSMYAQTILTENDCMEIVHFVGGG